MQTNSKQTELTTNSQLHKPQTHLATVQLLALARQCGWDAMRLGKAPFPEQPVRLGRWLVVPAMQDRSLMPERTMGRILAIYAAGLRPKGFVVVHEAPPELPEYAVNASVNIKVSTMSPRTRRLLKTGGGIALGLLAGVTVLPGLLALALLAVGAVAALLLPLVVLTGLAGIDPILVAVTEDDEWVEIDRWWNE